MLVFVRHLAAFSVIGTCAASDIFFRKIPNIIILPALMAALILDIVSPVAAEPLALLSLTLFVIILLIARLRGGVGGGDVKLYTFLCLIYPDDRALRAIAASIVLAAALIAFLCITGRLCALREGLPLAACAAGGTLISILGGRGIQV